MPDSRAILLAVLVVLAGCSVTPETDAGTPTPTTDGTGEAWTVTVERVVDGDTLEVSFPDGRTESVRLLGVDTPEVHVENDPAEFEGLPETAAGHDWLRDWGHRASEFARAELLGSEVTISTDPVADRRGDFGRLLVYVEDGDTDFNQALIEQGYARLYDSKFSRKQTYAIAEETAQDDGVGLWGFDGGAATAGTTTGPTTLLADGSGSPLAVVEVNADAAGNDNENLGDEYVVFENVGNETLDLSGWRVLDAANHSYAFPDGFALDPGARVTLHTGSGTDGAGDLYWGSGGAIWNNDGDTITVLDSDGERVLVREY